MSSYAWLDDLAQKMNVELGKDDEDIEFVVDDRHLISIEADTESGRILFQCTTDSLPLVAPEEVGDLLLQSNLAFADSGVSLCLRGEEILALAWLPLEGIESGEVADCLDRVLERADFAGELIDNFLAEAIEAAAARYS